MRPMHVRKGHDASMDEMAALAPRLHQFVAVARTEHMTHAADAIGVPQSTLSRGIARLEADLGVALFGRSGRTVRLTREGRTLLRHAERALAELSTGIREILGDADVLHGRVGLAFLTTLGSAAVPRLLRDFRTLHPGVQLDLLQGAHAVLLDRLRSGDADLALTSPLPDEPGLVAVPLDEEELRLVVPAGHRLAERDGVALAEAARETFVRFLPGFGLRGTVDAWCREAGFVPRVAFEGGDAETLRGLVVAGLGEALLPVAHHLLVPGVVELPVTEPRTGRPIGAVWAHGRPLPAPARALLDVVRSPGRRLLGS
ncbi:MAG: LysR family transcriptional regulator, transcription activator of glutamate synthase operon [Pseudonocardiales bacterium]|nr:LysR family transcriptional regulator, transcription activator of glutamate synthase operon [Pseudonocardiales bacterium]